MWMLGTSKMALTSIGIMAVISSDILSKIIGMSFNGIGGILSYFVSISSEDIYSQKYKNDLESMDIPMKLEYVNNWIESYKEKEQNNNINKNDALLYNSLSDITQKIHLEISVIESKINYHKTKWFHTWRILSLDNEIKKLEKYIKILDERLKFIY